MKTEVLKKEFARLLSNSNKDVITDENFVRHFLTSKSLFNIFQSSFYLRMYNDLLSMVGKASETIVDDSLYTKRVNKDDPSSPRCSEVVYHIINERDFYDNVLKEREFVNDKEEIILFLTCILFYESRLDVNPLLLKQINRFVCLHEIHNNDPVFHIANSYADHNQFMYILKDLVHTDLDEDEDNVESRYVYLSDFMVHIVSHPVYQYLNFYNPPVGVSAQLAIDACSGAPNLKIPYTSIWDIFNERGLIENACIASTVFLFFKENVTEIFYSLTHEQLDDILNFLTIANAFVTNERTSVTTATEVARDNVTSLSEHKEQKRRNSLRKYKTIATLCRDLIDEASRGELSPAISRENEVQSVVYTLSRKQKNHPILIGRPGVGKSAIAEDLAIKIKDGLLSDNLKGAYLFSLSTSDLLAGTKFRGDLEQRVKDLFSELARLSKDSEKKVILFVDEFHQIVKGGDPSTGMTIGNQLKPLLSKNDFSIIGATTYAEYNEFIQPDKAFARRFKKTDIKELSKDGTIKVLKSILPIYEKYHNVEVEKELLSIMVDLATRYIPSRCNPDISIDILDELCSRIKLSKRESTQIEMLYEVVSNMSNISNINKEKTSNDLTQFNDQLKKCVIGQDEAINEVCDAITFRNSPLCKNDDRPLSFLCQGPTGVGKTEMAKKVAEYMNIPLYNFNMSEYKGEMGVTKLIGSTKGFHGSDDGGVLSNCIKENPYSVILIDELEKSTPEVFNIFLQVLDNGSFVDGRGDEICCKNIVILMTTNAGCAVVDSNKKVGLVKSESVSKPTVSKEGLNEVFSPEFRNRFFSILSFNAISKDVYFEIVKKQVSENCELLKESEIILNVDNKSLLQLASINYDEKMGARPISKVIEKNLLMPVAKFIATNPGVKIIKSKVTKDGTIQIVENNPTRPVRKNNKKQKGEPVAV
jgi:ATP-dependent Clp protease ATP-binding subunit ClpA